MAKKTPAEFPSDWHFEQHLEDLSRELAGRQNRLAELEALPENSDNAFAIEQTKGEIEACKAELARYSPKQKTASKRPKAAAAKESR